MLLKNIDKEKVTINISMKYPRSDGSYDMVDAQIDGMELFSRKSEVKDSLAMEFDSLFIKLCAEVTVHDMVKKATEDITHESK